MTSVSDLGHRAGKALGLGDDRHLAEDGTRAHRFQDYATCRPFAKQGNLTAINDIGTIGGLALAVELAAFAQDKTLGAEGEQAQLVARKRLEQPHRLQNANIIFNCHAITDIYLDWRRA